MRGGYWRCLEGRPSRPSRPGLRGNPGRGIFVAVIFILLSLNPLMIEYSGDTGLAKTITSIGEGEIFDWRLGGHNGKEEVRELESKDVAQVALFEDDWNDTGVTKVGVSISADGKPVINRPGIIWNNSQTSLPLSGTGSSAVAIPGTNLTWIIGGRQDPNPMQNGDEFFSSEVVGYNIETELLQAVDSLPKQAAYSGSVFLNDNIVVIGDWWPGTSNPTVSSRGQVMIYNFTNSTWWNGSSMPLGKEVGHSGVAVLGQYIYVAGGVKNTAGTDATNRTLRYDLANDSWIEVAKMNNSKFALALVPYHGKLYAMGGGYKTFSWGSPTATKIIEVYDPAIDNWTQLNSTMPFPSAGLSAVVRHDEILIMGGLGVKKVAAWHPDTNKWRSLTDLMVNSGDHAAVAINGTVHLFGGDMSSNPYSSWGAQFMDDIQRIEEVKMVDGFLIGKMIDLRPSVQANAQLRSINVSAIEPSGTSITFQIRYGYDSNTANQRSWEGPDGSSTTWFESGEHILNVPGVTNAIQYKVRLMTTDIENWSTPILSNVSVNAAHAAFSAQLPSKIHPLGESFTISTEHADYNGTEYWLSLQPSASGGGGVGSPTILRLNGTSLSIDDSQGLLFGQPTYSSSLIGGTTFIVWNISLADAQPSTHMMFKAGNLVAGQDIINALNYLELIPVKIDQDLQVSISSLVIYGTSVPLQDGDVLSDGLILEMAIMSQFSDATNLMHGDFEWRVIGTLSFTNGSGWANWSEEWTTENISSISLPTNVSGFINLQLEVRTGLGIYLFWDGISIELVSDADNALYLSSIPENGTYVNSQELRKVSVLIGDSGGPDPAQTTVKVWIEGSNDSNLDGVADASEYYVSQWEMEGGNGLWNINLSLNDSVNQDHGVVIVKVIGKDRAGRLLGQGGSGEISFSWQTRDARLAYVVATRPLNEVITGVGQLIEPAQTLGWSIDLSDYNSISDISELIFTLGGDDQLGVRWDAVTGICMNLDGRLIPEKTSCDSTLSNEVLTLDLVISADWSFELQGLVSGKIDISVVDLDGINASWTENSSWYLSKETLFQSISLVDNNGSVTGDVENDHYAVPGDEVVWTVELSHLDSGRALEGPLSLYWQGNIQGEDWLGVSTVFAENGTVIASFSLPQREGLLTGTLLLMDIADTVELARLTLPSMHIDGTAPVLQASQKFIMESRYALDEVTVIVNILETASWSGELTLNCQVRAISGDWPVITATSIPDSTFGELVLFQFVMDLQSLGEASQLSDVATLACWMEGSDDAGNQLQLGVGVTNHQSSPWFTLEMPSNGPDLDIKLNWKQSMNELEKDKDILVEAVVSNLDETIERSFNLTIWLQNDEGESVVVFRNSRTNGLIGNQEWSMGFTISANESGKWLLTAMVDSEGSIAELNETNNFANASFTIADDTSGIMDILLSSTGVGGGLFIGLLFFIALVRNRKKSAQTERDAAIKSGPPIGLQRKQKSGSPPVSQNRVNAGPNSAPTPKDSPMGAINEQPSSVTSPALSPVMDVSGAAAALSSIAPSIEETQASFGEDNSESIVAQSSSNGVDNLVSKNPFFIESTPDVDSVDINSPDATLTGPPMQDIGAVIDDWEQLPWGGEYEYRSDGTYYVGEGIGVWQSLPEGKFSRVE